MKKNNTPKVQITFPNILLIPIFSIIGFIFKLFGLTQFDWLNAILTLPIALYFGWCIGYCILMLLSYLIIKIYSK